MGIGMAMVTGISMAGVGAENTTNSPYTILETYRQVLKVEPRDGISAIPQLAPVYNGHAWALSTRWDDSNPNALNVRRKMLENGIRGTFYLNSRKPLEVQRALACALSAGGTCSVGGHSVTHPHLPEKTANEAFRELMANRITLECLTDRPVNSLAFPFGGYRDKTRPEVLQGISEAFLRTRYQHCVYADFVLHNPFLPDGLVSTGLQVVPGDRVVDATVFWTAIEKIRRLEEHSRKTSNCIFLGVHPWQEGEELERLGKIMGTLHDWDDFWHCTQTEYAAFVQQYRHTTITALADDRVALQRPCAYELGSDVPLTLVFPDTTLQAASVDGVDCTLRHVDGNTIVNVPHAKEHGLPVHIDETRNGISNEFPGLKAILDFNPNTGELAFTLTNASHAALSDILLTVSLPPAFDPGLRRWHDKHVPAGKAWSVSATLAAARKGEYWRGGDCYAAAQLDFVLRGERGRLFTAWSLPAVDSK